MATRDLIFETERLLIHPYTMDDLDNFHRLNGDEEVMRYIRPFQTRELSRKFLQQVITDYTKRAGLGRWGMFAKNDYRFVGSFAIIPIEDSGQVQVGYALVKEEWGKGYASESLKGGLVYAFQKLGLTEIAGITFPENNASQKVLLRNGFVFSKIFIEEGKELHLYICRQ